jgi:RimJ/RimL family protein N-acetyltransferase
LRRVYWDANYFNKRSMRFAGKLGFKEQGVERNISVAEGRIAEDCAPGRPGDGSEFGSVSLWGSSITWEDWEGGVRDHVDKLVRES